MTQASIKPLSLDSYCRSKAFVKTDALGYVQHTGYDGADRITSLTDARGTVTQKQYDVHGNLIQETRALGTADAAVTRYVYDNNNRLFRQIRELNGRDLVTEFGYDDRGLMTTRIEGKHTSDPEPYAYEYNAGRQLINATDPKGHITGYFYDPLGREKARTQAGGLIEHYREYDAAGNPTLERQPEGEEVRYGYDPLNRLILVAKGQDMRQLAYDGRGRPVREIDYNHTITEYQYDAAGRLEQKIEALGTADEAITSLSYDENGNVISLTNPRGRTIAFEYDALNRKTKEIDSDGDFKTLTYDPSGNLDLITKRDNTHIEYTYDSLNRRIETRVGNVLEQRFEYDALSRMTLAEDRNSGTAIHTVDFAYTDFDRIESETQNLYTTSKQYDKNGNKTAVTYPSNSVVEKTYDGNDALIAITNAFGPVAAFARDRNSRLTSASFGNGAMLSLDYDGRGREVNRSYSTPGTNPLLHIQTGHDPESNITTETQVLRSALRVNDYTYDPLSRLTALTGTPGPEASWQYDGAGNWESASQNGVNETRTVNDDNEYTLVNGRNLVYDENGNLIFDNGKNFFYDWADRLITADDGGPAAHYTYDALNRRVTKTVGATTTTYVYDGSDLIEQYVNQSLERTFTYTGQTDDPVMTEYNGQSFYYLKDRQNGIRAITDESGDLVESYRYNAGRQKKR